MTCFVRRIVILCVVFCAPIYAQSTCLDTLNFSNSSNNTINSAKALKQAQKIGLYRFANEQGPVSLQPKIDMSFRDYIDNYKAIISARNPRAEQPCPMQTGTSRLLNFKMESTRVIDLIAPFELQQNNNEKAVLLFHGLTDSPFTFHELAAQLFAQGYSVRAALLPGHATAPSDLMEVNYKDWQQSIAYAIERTASDYKQFSILSYSTSSALTVHYLADHKVQNLSSLLLISPASEPHNKHGWLAKWVDRLPFVDWIDKDADLDFAKYESFPWSAATLAERAMKDARKASLPTHLPIFAAVSEVDTTIDSQATLNMLNGFVTQLDASTQYPLFWYGNPDTAQAILSKGYQVIEPKCTTVLCNKVLDMSHIGILQSPAHPLYGEHGLYRSCSGYLADSERYYECKIHPSPLLGERTDKNTAHKTPLARVTFNPAYQHFTHALHNFLNKHMQ